jgi:hypothetical protein
VIATRPGRFGSPAREAEAKLLAGVLVRLLPDAQAAMAAQLVSMISLFRRRTFGMTAVGRVWMGRRRRQPPGGEFAGRARSVSNA